MHEKQQIIDSLKLEPLLPEGGYFRRIYESTEKNAEARRYAASIFYMLESTDFSCFHRIDCDELWHFYAGDSMMIYQIKPDGKLREVRLGNPLTDAGAVPFALLEKNTWFAAEVIKPDSFGLVGCTTIPEFLFETFEAANRAELCEAFPQHQSLITRLTRE